MLTLTKKFDMINAWSLAGSVMDGTLDEDYPIMSKCKYEEDQTLELAKKYIESTYSAHYTSCLLYTSPSPRDISGSRMPSSA